MRAWNEFIRLSWTSNKCPLFQTILVFSKILQLHMFFVILLLFFFNLNSLLDKQNVYGKSLFDAVSCRINSIFHTILPQCEYNLYVCVWNRCMCIVCVLYLFIYLVYYFCNCMCIVCVCMKLISFKWILVILFTRDFHTIWENFFAIIRCPGKNTWFISATFIKLALLLIWRHKSGNISHDEHYINFHVSFGQQKSYLIWWRILKELQKNI
jgi:hypothetical protein